MHVVQFTEIYEPVQNGVVASIAALSAGLRDAGAHVTVVAPHLRGERAHDGVVRLPSLPLPTKTPYRLTVPVIPQLHDVAIVHAHSPFVTGELAVRCARRARVPLVFTYHTRYDEYAHYAPYVDRAVAARALNALTRAFANRADAVIAPTHAMRERLRELGVRAPVDVIASGIDPTAFAAERSSAMRARLGASGDEPLALVVGRLGREKDVELALEALALVPHLRLAIVGEGPHRPVLERLAARLGVGSRVRFTGALARAELGAVYAAADVFLFPSATDTQGLVLAEAQAAGLPVVARETPVAREGAPGARFAPREAARFARELAAAASEPRQSAEHLAHRGLTVGVQTRRTLELYREMLIARARLTHRTYVR